MAPEPKTGPKKQDEGQRGALGRISHPSCYEICISTYIRNHIHIYIHTVYTCIYTVYDECYCIGNINYGRYCVFIIMLFMMKITAMIIINMFTN